MSWAYSYCTKCGNGLAKASATEVINEVQVCPNCGTGLTPNISRDELLIAMADDIAELKERLDGPQH